MQHAGDIGVQADGVDGTARPPAHNAGIVGDITPTCGISDEEKPRLEAEAMQRLKDSLGGGTLAGQLLCRVHMAVAAPHVTAPTLAV